jgi:hypothetical protein
MDIDALDATGLSKKELTEAQILGADNLKRIHTFTKAQSPERILAFMEAKTVWHPIGI